MKDSVVAGMNIKTARYIYDHAVAMGFSKKTIQRKMKAKLGITDEV